MATNQDIISAVKDVVAGVSNIGTTHAYERWNANWSDYLDQFKATISGTVQVRGWVVTLDGGNPVLGEPYSFGNTLRTYNVQIFGILGLKDSSNTEQTFLNLAEAVMDALDAKKNLSVSGVVDYSVGPCTMRSYQIRQFGSVLCHYCEIILPVQVEKAITYS